jgi:hypothetical protein
MPNLGYIDSPSANWATAFLVENVVSFPLSDKPGNENIKQYDLTFVQAANVFTYANLGTNSALAPNAYLVEQSPLQKIGAGIIRYSRTYCEVPVQYYDFEQVFYSYPGKSSGTGVTYSRYGARKPITVPKLATVNHFFTLNANIPTANVQTVTIVTGNIMANNPQPVDWIGELSGQDNSNTVPNADPSPWIMSSDPVRWKGTIWEIVTKTVTQPNAFA